MNSFTDKIRFFALGMGAMYLVDPIRGRRRRALIKDKMRHGVWQAGQMARVSSKDLLHRARGMAHEIGYELRHAGREQLVPDSVLESRIRSKIGRVVSHIRDLDLQVHSGVVTLKGNLYGDELYDILLLISAIHGVKHVENHVVTRETDEKHQIDRRHLYLSRHRWSPAQRLVVGAIGGGLLLSSLGRHKPWARVTEAIGALFLLRSVTNEDWHEWIGVGDRNPIRVRKTVHIGARVAEVFDFWSNYRNFPLFLSDLKEVQTLSDGRSRWIVGGPAGIPFEWEAITTRLVPSREIAWRSLPGASVQNEGRILFAQNPAGSTRVDLQLDYYPPAGRLGHWAAKLFGADPKSRLDHDLVQIQNVIERGAAAKGVAVNREIA